MLDHVRCGGGDRGPVGDAPGLLELVSDILAGLLASGRLPAAGVAVGPAICDGPEALLTWAGPYL